MSTIPVPIKSEPGIKRDGTQFEGNAYVDGEWCRFDYRGLARKIGGYSQLSKTLSNICRGSHLYSRAGFTYTHLGSQDNLERLTIDNNTGAATGIVDRTPVAFNASANNIWQLDGMFDATSSTTRILAHAAPNLLDISAETDRPIYYGNIDASTALTAITGSSVSGGLVVLHPYLFNFGTAGYAGWSVPNKPDDLSGSGSGSARIAESKIVRGLPLRGGPGNAPSGLLWSLTDIIRVSYIGGSPIFQFDTLNSQSSILSPASVIEYDGVYYWCGVDRFLSFNGVTRETPNEYSFDWFFDNLNYEYRMKVFAYKVPHRGEIWFCFPYGTATECTHAAIYNVRRGIWYDTILPNGGRSTGAYAQTYRYPVMTGTATVANKSSLYAHEKGTDEVLLDGTNNAVRSYFTTSEMSLIAPPEGGKPVNKWLEVELVEPDFVQIGDMSVTVIGRANARAADVTEAAIDFPATPTQPFEQQARFKTQRRLMRFKFESNVTGGYYLMGNPLAHIGSADGSTLGAVA